MAHPERHHKKNAPPTLKEITKIRIQGEQEVARRIAEIHKKVRPINWKNPTEEDREWLRRDITI